MKFDACPVDPPGFGSGPLSSRTMSDQPCSARWNARLLPTIPAPITTAPALPGRPLIRPPVPLRYPSRAEVIYQSGGFDAGTTTGPAGADGRDAPLGAGV